MQNFKDNRNNVRTEIESTSHVHLDGTLLNIK